MEQLNRIELRGVVGSIRTQTFSDNVMARMTVATNYAYKDREGAAVIDTSWHSVVAWEGKNIHGLDKIVPSQTTSVDVLTLRQKCYEAMNDDLNSPIVIAHLFDGAKMVNNILAGNDTITADDLEHLKETFRLFCFDILGLKEEHTSDAAREEAFGHVVDMLLQERLKAKATKDWATSDRIRNELTALGFEIKDGKESTEWKLNK